MTALGPDIPARLRKDLRPDERVVAFAWAGLPQKRTGYFTDITTATIIDAVDLIRTRRATRKIRDRSATFGFPLDRRMAMAITDDRLVIWSGSRRALRAPTVLGDVPRSQILAARLPYIGGGWRSIEIRLAGGMGVRFLVDRHNAEAFAQALS